VHKLRTPTQPGRHQIVGITNRRGACPTVTFRLHAPPLTEQLLITLTLCEWRDIAHKIAEASAVLSV